MLLNTLITKAAVALFCMAILVSIIFTFKKLKIMRFKHGKETTIVVGRKKIYLYCFLTMLLSIILLAIFLPPINYIMHQDDVQNANNRVLVQRNYEPDEKAFILNSPFIIRGYVEKHIDLNGETCAVITNEIKGSNIESNSRVNFVYIIDKDNELKDGTRVDVVSKALRFTNVYVINEQYKTIVFGEYIVDMPRKDI